jgi:lipoprotein NlpI
MPASIFNFSANNTKTLFLEGSNAYQPSDAKNTLEKLAKAIYQELQKEQVEKLLLSNIYNTRGEVYLSIGALLRSHNDFSDAINFNPENENAINNMGVWYTMHSHIDPDFNKSLEYFDRAIAINPDRKDIMLNRAIARIKSGNEMGYEDLKKLELEKYEVASLALMAYGE